MEKWARKHDKCIVCGTTKIPHNSHGRCAKCHGKEYFKQNKATMSNYSRTYYRNNKKRYQGIQYQRKYGIGMEDYQNLLLEQNNKCAICGKHQEELSKILFIDHNHDTGKIRGLLCYNCNSAIGLFGENLATMARAITYLRN